MGNSGGSDNSAKNSQKVFPRDTPGFAGHLKIVLRKIKLIFGLKKFTLKTENINILTSLPQVVLQDIKRSFEGAHWDAKNYGNSPASL